MALIKDNSYLPSFLFRNKHFNTLYRTLACTPKKYNVSYKRQRISTPDDDFIDLDIATNNSKNAVIIIHGLEGSAQSLYVLSLVKYLNKQNIDAIAVNLRGCSGQDNKQLYAYHSGFTQDLECIIDYVLSNYSYKTISLVGYSLGANLVLKYMGEKGINIPNIVKSCIAVSAPCSLEDSSVQLKKKSNYIYILAFLKSLKIKARLKFKQFSNHSLDERKILHAKNFHDFDNYFTAPVFGFESAKDYWQKNSCKQFLKGIKKPTLLLTALDDPFFGDDSYPFKEAENHQYFDLLATKHGGHVGYNAAFKRAKNLWSEEYITNYIKEHLSTSQ